MRALVYGAGAVGLGIASCLLQSGEKLDVIARENTVSSLREGGLVRTGIFGDYQAGPEDFGSYSSLDDLLLDPNHTYDYVLVCTKSHDSFEAAKDIYAHSSFLSDEGKIVLFQNGWGNAEIFAEFFPKNRVYNARVITGFCRPQRNVVEVTVHADAIRIGSLFDNDLSFMEPLSKSITGGGIPSRVVDDVEKDLWAKMLYNCALNPLGAVFNVRYGVLGEWPYTRAIMEEIIKEIFRVMELQGYRTHWKTADEYIEAFYENLLPPTVGHESSTLQDIRAHKKTEIEALSGAIVRLAKEVEIGSPCNFMLYNMVRFMEARNLLEEGNE